MMISIEHVRHWWSVRRLFAVALVLGTLAFGVWAHAVGVRFTPVLSGSMRPAYATGSLVVTSEVASSTVRVGDVIAFRPPVAFPTPSGRPVLHRVVTAEWVDGHLQVTTRGDANPAPDAWTLDLTGGRVHRARGSVPVAGRLAAAIVSPALAVRAASLAGGLLVVGALLVWRRPRVEVAPC
jgi:signal peptidase I